MGSPLSSKLRNRAVVAAKQRHNETEVRLRDATTEIERLKGELDTSSRGRQSIEDSFKRATGGR
jgi:hypothetical protein